MKCVVTFGSPARHSTRIELSRSGTQIRAQVPEFQGGSNRLNRGTSSGDEGATPIATTTNPTYTDTNLSSTTVYFYEVTAVNSAEETPLPVGTGGQTPGRGLSGNSQVVYGRTRFFTRSARGHFYLHFNEVLK